MNIIPIEIFFRIQQFLPLVESIKLSQVSHGWKTCIQEYLQLIRIKPNKIIILKDMIDWGYRPRIQYTHLAKHVLYHILLTLNRPAYDFYMHQEIFKPLLIIYHRLILYQNPNHPVQYLDNINEAHIYQVFYEALHLGNENLAKKIVRQDMRTKQKLKKYLYTTFMEMDEMPECVSDDFIIWFFRKYHKLDSIHKINIIPKIKRSSLLDKLVQLKLLNGNDTSVRHLVKYNKIDLIKRKYSKMNVDLFQYILFYDKMWMFNHIKMNREDIKKCLTDWNINYIKTEKTMLWLINKIIYDFQMNVDENIIIKCFRKDWIKCITILIPEIKKEKFYFSNFSYIKSISMLDLVLQYFDIPKKFVTELFFNAIYKNKMDLAKRYNQLISDSKCTLIIEIYESKPHLISLLQFSGSTYIRMHKLKNQIFVMDPEDIKWLLMRGYPYSHHYLMKYQNINPELFQWLQVNCFV